MDEKTRYVTNRLKEIKYERFKAYFKGDEDGLDKRAPNLERVQAADPMRADGSCDPGKAASRASFHS